MLEHQGALDIVLLAAGVITIAGGVLLALRAVRNAMTGFLASWFFVFGLAQVGAALRWSEVVPWFGMLANHVQLACLVGFGIAIPHRPSPCDKNGSSSGPSFPRCRCRSWPIPSSGTSAPPPS